MRPPCAVMMERQKDSPIPKRWPWWTRTDQRFAPATRAQCRPAIHHRNPDRVAPLGVGFDELPAFFHWIGVHRIARVQDETQQHLLQHPVTGAGLANAPVRKVRLFTFMESFGFII